MASSDKWFKCVGKGCAAVFVDNSGSPTCPKGCGPDKLQPLAKQPVKT